MPLTQAEQDELELLELEREKAASLVQDSRSAPDKFGRFALDVATSGPLGVLVPEKYRPSLATKARIGLPVAGAMLAPVSGGTSIPAAMALTAAAGGAGGLLGETVAEGVENVEGTRSGVDPRAIAASGLINAVPLIGKGPALLRIPANAALQALTSVGGDLVRNGDVNLLHAGIAGTAGGVGSVAEPIISGVLRGGARALDAKVGGASAMDALRQGGAEAFRPQTLSPAQIRGQAARDEIEALSGIRPPTQISEAIRTPQVTKWMDLPPDQAILAAQRRGGKPLEMAGTEMSPDDFSRITKLVAEEGAKIKRTGADPVKVSEQLQDVLRQKGVEINEATIGEVNRFAGVPSTPGIFPTVREPKAVGEEARQVAKLVQASATKDFNAAYDAARTLPNWNAVKVDSVPIGDFADRLGLQFAPDATGSGFLVVSAAPGSRSATGSLQNVPANLTLDQARGISSELGRRLAKAGPSPTSEFHNLGELKKVVDAQIAKGVAPFKDVEKALGDANAMYASDIGRFRSSTAKGLLSETGEQGGDIGESIVADLTGPKAASNYEELLKIFGAGSKAGADASSEAKRIMREAVLSKAKIKAVEAGQVSPRRAVEVVESLPESVRNDLFPDSAKMRASVDAQAKELAAIGIDKLPEHTAGDVYEYLLQPANAEKARRAMGIVAARNPALAGDVQGLFLDELLSKATVGRRVDSKALSGLLDPSAKLAPGKSYATSAENILGTGATADLRKIAAAMADIPVAETITSSEERGLANMLLLGNTGAGFASSSRKAAPFLTRVMNAAPEMRYRLAAKILTDDNLRRQAMKARGADFDRVLEKAMAGIIQTGSAQAP